MSNNKKNIIDMPYAEWLEQTLHDISDLPVKSIALVGVLEDGGVYGNYYECMMTDKILISGIINQDAMLDMMAAQGIVEYDDEEDNNGEEEE